MSHWSERYLGRPHVKGVYDCAELVMEVQREQFNRNVEVPVERKEYSTFVLSSLIDEHKFEMAEIVSDPIEGDVLLMKCMNRLNHIGVYVTIDRTPYVLHNLQRVGVCLHRIADLQNLPSSIEVENYYRFKPSINTGHIKHKDCDRDPNCSFAESTNTDS